MNYLGPFKYCYYGIKAGTIKYLRENISDRNKPFYVVITIDTEQDVSSNYINLGTYNNVKKGIPRLTEIFDRYNAKATWMVTPDVVIENSHEILELKKQGHEIGCHIHPEYFLEKSISNMRHKMYLHLQPVDQQMKMIREATETIKKCVGMSPISFRAGRYGISKDTLIILRDEGYLVDSSVTPCISWTNDGGPDWSKYPDTQPYLNERIMEAPISIINRLGFKYWLRPSVSDFPTMKNIIDILSSRHKDILVLNIMFHSMETIDPNPYLNSRVFFHRLERIVEYLSLKNVIFITLEQLYHELKGKNIDVK